MRRTSSRTKTFSPFKWLLLLLLAAAGAYAALLFAPKDTGKPYTLRIAKGQGMAAVSRRLADEGIVYSRWVLLSAAYFDGSHDKLKDGSYRLPARLSAWEVLQRLKSETPDTVRVQIIEGMRFSQMRRLINQNPDIRHDTAGWSDEQLLNAVASDIPYRHPEGLFFPDSYEISMNSSDLQIFQAAHKAMNQALDQAWESRSADLPYQDRYQLLIMASLIEKETAHAEDRGNVSSVFRNRLRKNMRLQTDPTVIYGMGDAYQGKIRKADLQRDTPYNTYTRNGLPPTPIALPGRAALEAAAHPADSDYLYFVSRMDGSGKSRFSRTLEEHNAAVRQYILKK